MTLMNIYDNAQAFYSKVDPMEGGRAGQQLRSHIVAAGRRTHSPISPYGRGPGGAASTFTCCRSWEENSFPHLTLWKGAGRGSKYVHMLSQLGGELIPPSHPMEGGRAGQQVRSHVVAAGRRTHSPISPYGRGPGGAAITFTCCRSWEENSFPHLTLRRIGWQGSDLGGSLPSPPIRSILGFRGGGGVVAVVAQFEKKAYYNNWCYKSTYYA
jgi:hypothetical protein